MQSLKLVKDDVVPPLQEGLKNTLNSVFTGIPSLVQKVKNIMVYQYSVKCGVVVWVGGGCHSYQKWLVESSVKFLGSFKKAPQKSEGLNITKLYSEKILLNKKHF